MLYNLKNVHYFSYEKDKLIVIKIQGKVINIFYRILCGNWHIIACKNHTGITFTETFAISKLK